MNDLIYQDETISMQEFINRTINEVMPKNDGLKIDIYREEMVFDSLKNHWNALAARTGATIYMSYDWAKTWWDYYGSKPGRTLFFVTIWRGSKLVALAPFYKEVSRIGNREIESRIRLLGSGGSPSVGLGFKDDYGISDFLDILVDPDYKEPVAEKLVKIIESSYFDADQLSFDQARDDSFVITELYPKLKESLLEPTLSHTDTCPYIDLSEEESMKGYIKKQKSSARRRIRQTRRATGPEDEFVIEEPKSWDEVQKATDRIIKLHQDRWNEIGFPGVFYEDRFVQFFREIVRQAYEKDRLWFKEARDNKGICASRMIIYYNGRYFDYISGFDDNRESAKRRPGIGLLVELIEEAIEDGVERVELLRGEEYYKYDFTDKNFKNWKLSVPLKESASITHKGMQQLLHTAALVYKYTKSETRLMNVQRKQNGWLKMLPGYVSFRWKSLKLKLQ